MTVSLLFILWSESFENTRMIYGCLLFSLTYLHMQLSSRYIRFCCASTRRHSIEVVSSTSWQSTVYLSHLFDGAVRVKVDLVDAACHHSYEHLFTVDHVKTGDLICVRVAYSPMPALVASSLWVFAAAAPSRFRIWLDCCWLRARPLQHC